MNFTAKLGGPAPLSQDQVISFNDCDTGVATTDAPTTLNVASNAAWLKPAFVPPSTVRVSANSVGLAVGTYSGSISITIPDTETCEVGKVFSIPVTLTVQKGKVKFR